jgi:hypothetical protein
MADQNLAEQVKNDVRDLQSSLRELQGSVRMTEIRDSIEDLKTDINGFAEQIKSLRKRGYAFEKELEARAEVFEKDWSSIEPGLINQIEEEVQGLTRSLKPLESQITAVAGDSSAPKVLQPRVERIKSQVETIEGRVEAIEDSIRGRYDDFSGEVNKFNYYLDKLDWTLTELSEASFDLLATESAIMAVKAVWSKGEKQKKGDPKGVLYLTDQRLIFEQKQKVATKKVLFVATEKELVQETLWEIPVVLVEEIKSRDEGFLGKDDYIDLQLKSGAPLDLCRLHIWQPGEEWVSLVNRARAGEFDKTRAIPVDQAVLEKVKNAPTKCPSCGGAINQVILRGMDSFNCEYCGDTIRW